MGSSLVTLEHPPVSGFADVFQADEQMSIQQLVEQHAIEPFDVGVLWFGSPGWMYWIAIPAFFAH